MSAAIYKLKYGITCGSGDIYADHYIHADSRLSVLLSEFFTSALTHRHVPDDFHANHISSADKIIKSGDSSEVNN